MTALVRPLPTRLFSGPHQPDGEMCVMEAVAWAAGEAWTDTPACACPVITRYAQVLNDRMDDQTRQRLLPYVSRLIGTRSTWAVEQRRALRAADWAVRRFASAALLAAGLTGHARTLQELTPIVDRDAAGAAARAAWAARDAAGDAAGAAAGAAARAAWAARDAAGAAARAAWAAGDAAEDAARAAAWAAARAAWAAAEDAGDAAEDAAGAAAEDAAWDLALLCLDDLLSITEEGS